MIRLKAEHSAEKDLLQKKHEGITAEKIESLSTEFGDKKWLLEHKYLFQTDELKLELKKNLDETERLKAEHLADKDLLQKKHNDITSKKIESLSKEHEAKRRSLEQKHLCQISELKSERKKNLDEIERIKVEHSAEKDLLQKEHKDITTEKIDSLSKEFEAKRKSLEQKHLRQIGDFKSERKKNLDEIEKLKNDHSTEVNLLMKKHEEELQGLTNQVEVERNTLAQQNLRQINEVETLAKKNKKFEEKSLDNDLLSAIESASLELNKCFGDD